MRSSAKTGGLGYFVGGSHNSVRVGSMLGHLGSMLAHVGSMLVHIGPSSLQDGSRCHYVDSGWPQDGQHGLQEQILINC